MTSIDKTLAERGSRYGEFPGHASITQTMKMVMGGTPGWQRLANDQKEALEMVAHKIGRILNGDPNYIDSWTDIIGYTRLVEKRLIDGQTPMPLGTTSDRNTPLPKANVTSQFGASATEQMASAMKPPTDSITGMAATCSCEACACAWASAKADVESGAKIDEKVDDLIILFFGPAPKT